jgi:hypothetical protein
VYHKEVAVPEHVAIAHVVAGVLPIAVCLALAYAAKPGLRVPLRMPMFVSGLFGFVLMLWASSAGSALYRQLVAEGEADRAATAHAHGEHSVVLATALAALVAVESVIVWRTRRAKMRRARRRRPLDARIPGLGGLTRRIGARKARTPHADGTDEADGRPEPAAVAPAALRLSRTMRGSLVLTALATLGSLVYVMAEGLRAAWG